MSTRTSRLIAACLLTLIVAAGALASLVRAGQEKGQEEKLNKSELATTVTITPVGTDLDIVNRKYNARQQYSASQQEDKQLILVSMTNTATEPVRIILGDSHVQYRLQLFKDGKLVPYKESLAKILEAKDRDGPGPVRVTGTTLQPNETMMVDFIDLADWYAPLEPGQYELTIKYRSRQHVKSVETNTIKFKIVP
jgi:hypothetical protein